MVEHGGGRALNDEGVFVDTQRISVSSGDSGREPGVRPLMGDRKLCVCCSARHAAMGGVPMVTKDTPTRHL